MIRYIFGVGRLLEVLLEPVKEQRGAFHIQNPTKGQLK